MITEINIENLKTPLPKLNLGKCWIAGGAIRDSLLGVEYSDVDIFGKTEDLIEFTKNNLTGTKQVFDSQYVKTYIRDGVKIQVIFRDYTNILACLDSFDYTICMLAYDGDKLYADSNALIHLFNRRLVINKLNPDFVVSSLERLQKYIQKGFTICNGGLKQIVEGLRNAQPVQIENQFEYYPGSGTLRIRRFD